MPKNLAPVDHGGAKGVNVADPTAAQDVASMAYVDRLKGWFLLGSHVLGADTATLNVDNIPGTCDQLEFLAACRSDAAATADNAALALNNNTTGADYDREQVNNGVALETLGGNARRIGTLGNTAAANCFTRLRGVIDDYASATHHKVVDILTTQTIGRATTQINQGRILIAWYPAGGIAAITRITLAPVTGANWKAGSQLLVYGRKAA